MSDMERPQFEDTPRRVGPFNIDPRIDEAIEAAELDWGEMSEAMQGPQWAGAEAVTGRLERVRPVQAPSVGKVDPVAATACLRSGRMIEITVVSQVTQKERDRMGIMLELTQSREGQDDELVRDIHKDDPRWHWSKETHSLLDEIQNEMRQKDGLAEDDEDPPITLAAVVTTIESKEVCCGKLRRAFVSAEDVLSTGPVIKARLRYGARMPDGGVIDVLIRGESDEPHWRLVGCEGTDYEQKDPDIPGDVDRDFGEPLPWRVPGQEGWIEVSTASDPPKDREDIDTTEKFLVVPRFDHPVGIGLLVIYPDRKSLYPRAWLPPEIAGVIPEDVAGIYVHGRRPDSDCPIISRGLLLQLIAGTISEAACSHILACAGLRTPWEDQNYPLHEHIEIVSRYLETAGDITEKRRDQAQREIDNCVRVLGDRGRLVTLWYQVSGIDLGIDWSQGAESLSVNPCADQMPELVFPGDSSPS